MNEPKSDGQVAQLAAELRRLQIRHAFVYASYLKPHGAFNPTYAHASGFVRPTTIRNDHALRHE